MAERENIVSTATPQVPLPATERTIDIDDARKRGIPLPVPERSQATPPARPRKARKRSARHERKKFTIDEAIKEAFTYEQRYGTRDLQKTLLAIALLLNEESDYGNQDVDGQVAQGLSELVRICAYKLRDWCQSKHPDVRIADGEAVAVEPEG